MAINALPPEILHQVLREAAVLNELCGVKYTYGLRRTSKDGYPVVQKYVNGMLLPDVQRWDASTAIRQVCAYWHIWALEYSVKELYLRRPLPQSSDTWANLPRKQRQFQLYEICDCNGTLMQRDPVATLRKSAAFLREFPKIAIHVRRIWLNGFHTAETDPHVQSVLRSCSNLQSASLPAGVIQRLPPSDLQRLVNNLHSLEIQAVDLTEIQKRNYRNLVKLNSFEDVDFSALRRLKIIGGGTSLSITDTDLIAIAKSATLQEFHVTAASTISILGVFAIIKASQKTLRVLDYSPRSQHGFFHPHPGHLAPEEHICDTLASCPKLESLSISVPSMCAALFSNTNVRWHGECQVRAAHLCQAKSTRIPQEDSCSTLRSLLSTARDLVRSRAASILPASLYIELFFSNLIFEPGSSAVHGVFQRNGGAWPNESAWSSKESYGSTGLYEKELYEEEKEHFVRIREEELLRGVCAGFFRLMGDSIK